MDILELIKPLTKSREYREALGLPEEIAEEYSLLAAGEYNVNLSFTHPVTKKELILRINQGSQMGLENQIEYEADTLRLLENSKRTPKLYYVDGSRKYIDKGILVMEKLDGVALDYRKDLKKAADILIDIHRQPFCADNHLIEAGEGFAFVLKECEEMLKHYKNSEYRDEAVFGRIRLLLDRGWKMEEAGKAVSRKTYKCIINTELNSGNFLINNDGKTDCLIDWEKAVIGSPSQDIGHFLAPTTTFWKTDVVLTEEEIEDFIEYYIKKAEKFFDTEGIRELGRQFIRINCLRGLTWCAMAYVQYKNGGKELLNESTEKKLDAYLSDSFLTTVERIF